MDDQAPLLGATRHTDALLDEEARTRPDGFQENSKDGLRRGLAQRHLSMMGIAGAIGTGLFLGLGQAVRTAGPLGSLLGYATVGLVVCAVQLALGEVAALMPVTGSFVRHAETLVDPALSFAVGWNLVYGNILSIPSEITAICVLISFWTDANPAWFILFFIVVTSGVGLALVRVLGEVEYVFAALKIALVIFLVVLGLLIDLGLTGTEPIGFRYWHDPGPFVEYISSGSWGHFLGYWSVMTSAVFSFAGVESIAMAGAETTDPRRAIPAACKQVFVRIVVFYMLAILVVGLLVASDDPRLGGGGTVAQSPFVIAASAAGIKAVPSIVNGVVITSAWSASNQALLSGTRTLYGLALKGQAPKVFLKTTPWGSPYACVLLFTGFMLLSLMCLSSGALTVFHWLVSLTAAGVLLSWCAILLNHIRLMMALRAQGLEAKRLPWHNSWTWYTSPIALFMCLVILLTSGFVVFTKGNWDANIFVSAYLDIPIVITAYVSYKYVKETRVIPLTQIPLEKLLEDAEDNR